MYVAFDHSTFEFMPTKEISGLPNFVFCFEGGKIQESPHLCVERSFTLEEHKAHEDCRCVGNILQLFKFRSS